MLIMVEAHRVGKNNEVIYGTNSDRVILYHHKSVEELLQSENFTINDATDLLTSQKVIFDQFQLAQFNSVGIHL
jgi:hypothetical protein